MSYLILDDDFNLLAFRYSLAQNLSLFISKLNRTANSGVSGLLAPASKYGLKHYVVHIYIILQEEKIHERFFYCP